MTGILLTIWVLAQPWAPPSAPAGNRPATPESERFRVIAVEAWQEGRGSLSLDTGLEGLRGVAEKLPFDTYRLLSSNELEAAYGSEATAPLPAEYQLLLTPRTRDAEHGAVEISARIEAKREGRQVVALQGDGLLAQGQALVFRGLPLPPHEMLVIMELRPPEDESGASGQSSEAPSEPQSQEEQEAQAEQTSSQEQQSAEEKEAASPEEEAKSEEKPEDLQNIEALLQSLEETDRREQAELRHRRSGVNIPKEWW